MPQQDKDSLLLKINEALEDIRPHLAVDGGDVEVLDITDDLTVRIKWLGNCVNCTMSTMTMKAGIEQAIKGKVPEIKTVEAVNGSQV
ncbi:MAG: NifU family protein [Saprospiraceae bacterium]|nr:NifU family protein [Saprospiraceae bacterium]MCB0623112.1 NifU family protein [Saprospiraceae bacterium]MCB0677972.1 NifU family protein [Saprospiraceae bacterium]MCB0683265.1 NifU family protein [Saprospiraceae bacterium]